MPKPPDRYAVFGNPVAHSRSPRIHQLFARQTAQALVYDAHLVPMHGLKQALHDFQDSGGKGVNVTVPFKQDALAEVDDISARAARAGAVNTIIMRADGSRYGDNTDGIGLLRDLLQNQAATLHGRRVLLLGAGGAARGVLEPLLAERPRELVIANRNVPKAEALAADYAERFPVYACAYSALQTPVDLIINASAASLHGELPPLPESLLTAGTWVYDMMYGAEPTPLMRFAAERGVHKVMDGLGMLVEQAAEAFYAWRGVRPETSPVIATVRKEMYAGVF